MGHLLKFGVQQIFGGRAVCPANEGIETSKTLYIFPARRDCVARSAPLMRGLKLCRRGDKFCGPLSWSRGLPR